MAQAFTNNDGITLINPGTYVSVDVKSGQGNIAASLGLHWAVLLTAAWIMAVLPERPKKRPYSLLTSHTDHWRER